MSDETGNPRPGNRLPPVETRFKKGQSGNPSGRPKKVIDVAAIARDSSTAAIEKLAALVNSNDDRVALAAASAILDRAIGKPTQSMTVTSKRDVTDYDMAELYAIARGGRPGDYSQARITEEPDPVH